MYQSGLSREETESLIFNYLHFKKNWTLFFWIVTKIILAWRHTVKFQRKSGLVGDRRMSISYTNHFLIGRKISHTKNKIGFVVLDKQKEGVVFTEPGNHSYRWHHHDGSSGGHYLLAFFIDIHEGTVQDLGQKEVSLG